MRVRRRTLPGALLLATVTAACASAPAAEQDMGNATAALSTIVVQNNHGDGRDLIIYLEPQGRGERQQLGVVAVNQTRTFTHAMEAGYYTFIAGHNLGDVESERFNITGPSDIRWTLVPNRVTTSRKR